MAGQGHLVIVGGAEERNGGEMPILTRVVELAGGKKGHIVVLTTASRQAEKQTDVAEEFRRMYEDAFKACGIGKVTALHIHNREMANNLEFAETIYRASGVFMTGGDQARLASILGGTEVGDAMHRAFRERRAVIAGTSAGASAFSEHMMMGGPSDPLPKKGMVPIAPGLGFLYQVIIDQHFSQRQRLGRLLSVIAQNPFLLGVGIDEDTALIVEPERSLEVVGSGAVTIVDGRGMIYCNINDVDPGDVLALSNIQLHLLPSGFRHRTVKEKCPTAFEEVLDAVMVTVKNDRGHRVPRLASTK